MKKLNLNHYWTQSLICFLSLVTLSCSSSSKSSNTHLPEEKQAPQASAPTQNTELKDLSKADPHWSYQGTTGPEFWGQLDSKFSLCKTGDNQSPVDLKWAKPVQNRPLDIHYQSSSFKIIDNGHAIEIKADPGSFLKINGSNYQLRNIHFHSQSEHTLSGKHYPMEMHLVHQSQDGQIAVLGRMIEVGKKPHPFIEKIIAHLPREKNKEIIVPNETIDFNLAIPQRKTYYNYSGSLTTPPCTEGVDWNVLNTPLAISEKQLLSFRALYGNNSRPIQQKNGRKPANY